MILINLLPHREAKRRQRKRAFIVGVGASLAIGVAIAALWYAGLQQMLSAQQARNDFLVSETTRLDAQIKDIATLRAEIDGLKTRQRAVEDLQLNRNVPVHLLDELVQHTPEGIYLTAVRQTDAAVVVSGMAQTNERVSEMLRSVQNRSQWLTPPELVEIKAVNLPAIAPSREPRRLYEFSLKVSLKMPGAAASAPASGASAAPVATGRKAA